MKATLHLENILVHCEEQDKYFFTEFDNGINIIHGRNTSGKSTLILLILYAFGINDNKIKLKEILSESIIVRLDCIINKNNNDLKYTLIRQDETLVIRDYNNRVLRFNGISSDNSNEHIKLKKYLSDLFNFDLLLEQKQSIVTAPIETIFLPYYVAQDVGWVYLRKSFNNLNFYKNFKYDFLDYYLGIENVIDRVQKQEIENKISILNNKISFLNNVEQESEDLVTSKIQEDSFTGNANGFIESMSSNKNRLLELENKHVKVSNQLTFYNQRMSVIRRVSRNHKKQFPGIGKCPTCTQLLPNEIAEVYEHYQEENDTNLIKNELNERIKESQSTLNSLDNKITNLKVEIKNDYILYNEYSKENLTFDKWVNNKANTKLLENLFLQKNELQSKLTCVQEELVKYKTDKEIFTERNNKNIIFKEQFFKNNIELGIPNFEDDRFSKIYEISSFPFLGVELHLAVLSYHFAFNFLLSKINHIHRLPLLLDSVFEGDVDGKNKNKILKFIQSNCPKDTQCIISIADSKEKDSKIDEYSTQIFKNNVKLICIGDGINKKSLLNYDNGNQIHELINSTFEILETV